MMRLNFSDLTNYASYIYSYISKHMCPLLCIFVVPFSNRELMSGIDPRAQLTEGLSASSDADDVEIWNISKHAGRSKVKQKHNSSSFTKWENKGFECGKQRLSRIFPPSALHSVQKHKLQHNDEEQRSKPGNVFPPSTWKCSKSIKWGARRHLKGKPLKVHPSFNYYPKADKCILCWPFKECAAIGSELFILLSSFIWKKKKPHVKFLLQRWNIGPSKEFTALYSLHILLCCSLIPDCVKLILHTNIWILSGCSVVK